MFFVRQQSL